jgi:hypothetical protein
MKENGTIDPDEMEKILLGNRTSNWSFFAPEPGMNGGTIFKSVDNVFVIAVTEDGLPLEGRLSSYLLNGLSGLRPM